MQTQIQKWGNSLGIRIPKYLANKLHFKKGAVVNLELLNNQIIISQEITELDLLLNKITEANRHHETLNYDDTIGNETW